MISNYLERLRYSNPLSACRNLILRHPIAVSGESATCAQVVAERANTVGLLLVRHISVNSGLPYCPTAYNKSRKKPTEELEETEVPIIHDTTMNEEIQEEDRELEEPQEPIDPPLEKNPHKRKLAWV